MTLTSIPRIQFPDSSTPSQREELAQKSRDLLGYDKLAKAILTPGTLHNAMKKLDMQPLSPTGVSAYKRKKAKPGLYSSQWKGIMCIGSSLILLIACCFGSWKEPNFKCLVSILSGLSGVILAIVGYSCLTDPPYGTRTFREWRLVAIQHYKGTIPEFVLYKAIQLKTELPDVKLFVDQLLEFKGQLEHRAPDPFLVARLGEEEFFVDVWDEKEYEDTI